LAKRRQSAWKTQNWSQYRRYRNQAQRLAKTLKQKYYTRHVQFLRKANPRKWWREARKVTGQPVKEPFASMIDTSYNGNPEQFCSDVNVFLKSVSENL